MKKIFIILMILITNNEIILSKEIKNNSIIIQSETIAQEIKNLDNKENISSITESSSDERKNTSTTKNKKKTFGGDLLKGLKSCVTLLFLTLILSLTKVI